MWDFQIGSININRLSVGLIQGTKKDLIRIGGVKSIRMQGLNSLNTRDKK